MRKIVYILVALMSLATSCSNNNKEFVLKGHISGLSSDTLLVHYQVPEYKLDTIFCQDRKFEYTLLPDTTTYFTLIFNAEESLPVFAERGQKAQVTGTTTEPVIQGEGENKLMNHILTLLRERKGKNQKDAIDSLLKANAHSFTNLYLIDQYYIHNKNTNNQQLKELVEAQSGILRDTPPMMDLLNKLNHHTSTKSSNVHTLSAYDRNGKAFRWSTIKNKYILIDFWASWHPQSIVEQDSLQSVIKALKKEDFIICSLSLDLDKEAWLKNSDRDTTQWYQICEFNGWNHSLVEGQHIQSLPSNLLLDRNKRIIARDIRGQKLIDKVKELIKKDKEREKQKKSSKKKK